MADIGSRIKEIRKDSKLTQDNFGNKIGLKDSAVSMLERNERNLTEAVIKNIITQFCVNEAWLKNGVGEKYNQELIKKKSFLCEPLVSRQLTLLDKIKLLSPDKLEEVINILDHLSQLESSQNTYVSLSDEEKKLIEIYRSLTDRDKGEVRAFTFFKSYMEKYPKTGEIL